MWLVLKIIYQAVHTKDKYKYLRTGLSLEYNEKIQINLI